MSGWPRVGATPAVSGRLRTSPGDFRVEEQLGFDLEGDGEHVFLFLEKQLLTTNDLQQRLSTVAGVHPRDVGYAGLKDKVAVTRQWFSVGLKGKPEADWSQLENDGQVRVLEVQRHRRKLKRGVHRANRFELVLRELRGDRENLVVDLQRVAQQGVPNYFGEQRFGRSGQTLAQARRWVQRGGRLSRQKRGFYLSALRSQLFNELLAARVLANNWSQPMDGDVCQLQGVRSVFACARADEEILGRASRGDLHPALPLWGRGRNLAGAEQQRWQRKVLAEEGAVCEFLEAEGLELDWRASRLLPDDFCWQFCDDGGLRLQFSLPPGAYATAVLAELVNYKEGDNRSGNGK